MGKLKCPKCGSEYLGVRADHYCLSCGWNNYTVFHRITASPEVLAEELITTSYDELKDCTVYWAWLGNGRREAYYSKPEAIAATVAILKKVAE